MRLRIGALWLLEAALAVGLAPRAAAQGEVGTVLQKIGAYVEDYYSRARSFVGTETVRLQSLRPDLMADGFARRLDYELRVDWTPRVGGDPATATMVRQLVTINGRAPRPKDEPQCLDPRTEQAEPMSMLLPESQSDYKFSWAGLGRVERRRVAMIDFKEIAGPTSSVEWKKDCLSVQVTGQSMGRVWADPETGEVWRLDTHLKGMVDFPVPRERQREWGMFVTLDRSDFSVSYRPVTFRDPDETLLLPTSIETVSVWRGASSSRSRKTQLLSNYRRFVTGGRVVDAGDSSDSDGSVPDGVALPSAEPKR